MSQQAVVREGNAVRILSARLNSYTIRGVIASSRELIKKGYEDCEVDLSRIQYAYPDGESPLVALTDWMRSQGCEIEVIPPKEGSVVRVLENTGVLHLCDPTRFADERLDHRRHLPVLRFKTGAEQHQIVAQFMETILSHIEMSKETLEALEWSFGELTDNVINHANSAQGGLAQLSVAKDGTRANFVVCDAGIGIPASLRQSSAYKRMRQDNVALAEAVKQGVTRDNSIGQGNGLAGSLRIATDSGGSISIHSQRGGLLAERDSSRNKQWPAAFSFPGTVVHAIIDCASNVSVGNALDDPGYSPTSYAGGLTDDEEAIRFLVKREATGFGSREGGQALRVKCLNLLRLHPEVRILIDWGAIPVIASSFADEFIGKLFFEIGPVEFASRIQFYDVEPTVQRIVNSSLLQRVRQPASGTGDGSD